MKEWKKNAALLISAAMLFIHTGSFAETPGSAYERYLADGTVPSLQERYRTSFEIGIQATDQLAQDAELTVRQCGSLVCETMLQGKTALDRASSKKKKDPERARVVIGKASEALAFAGENGMTVRAGGIIRPGNTPEWFFAEDWSDRAGTSRVSRETMIRRMENAIAEQMDLLNEKYPGLIAEWTVVTAPEEGQPDLFREVIGDDYTEMAFSIARRHAAEGQLLLYGVPALPEDREEETIRALQKEGLLDGVRAEIRSGLTEEDAERLEEQLKAWASENLAIHLYSAELANDDWSAEGQMRMAIRYRALFRTLESLQENITCVSLKALKAGAAGKKNTCFFSAKGNCMPAFFGALQDDSIPESAELAAGAAEKLNLEQVLKGEEKPVNVYKTLNRHNPVAVQKFGADPWAMVYRDRVYLYMTGDEPMDGENGKPKTNDYSNITTLRVFSSDDLVNWEDHGSVRAAGRSGAAVWASNSWAPCAAWKTIDGKDRFFLYFANSGGGIGVLTADSPTGPFTDPLGKALVSRNTPTCASVTWLFDPAVLVDEDGSAYLYFGGGIPEGKQASPGTARAVRLADDMIHLDGDPVQISPPWLFEDSGINRFGNTYVYSYCSNFNVPSSGSEQGFGSGEIVYMTSENPLGPFEYKGQILKNPGTFFGVGGNNHHCMFSFRDQWYITYHAATVDRDMGWNAGYRSTFVDRLEIGKDGLPAPSKGTYSGVSQLQDFDPYRPVPAATAASMAGIRTELAQESDRKAGTGPMAAISEASGAWIGISGVAFGEAGASSLRVKYRSGEVSRIEVLLDQAEGEAAAVLELPVSQEEAEQVIRLPEGFSGTHDLYFRFAQSDTALLEWQFE